MPQNHENTKMLNKKFEPIPEELENIGKKIVDAAYLVSKSLGPGLLEKVYEICFCHELAKKGLKKQFWNVKLEMASEKNYFFNFSIKASSIGVLIFITASELSLGMVIDKIYCFIFHSFFIFTKTPLPRQIFI